MTSRIPLLRVSAAKKPARAASAQLRRVANQKAISVSIRKSDSL